MRFDNTRGTLRAGAEAGATRGHHQNPLGNVNVLLPVVHPRMGTPLSAADTSPLLEAPGFMLLNYGRATPMVTLLAHLAYGAIVGGFIGLAS